MEDNETYTVSQASDYLGLSSKTIRKYIYKGLLKANKWNGMWVIESGSVREVKRKISGTSTEHITLKKEVLKRNEKNYWVEKKHYDDLMLQIGQLRAAESLLVEYKEQIQELSGQIRELEREIGRLQKAEGGFWQWICWWRRG